MVFVGKATAKHEKFHPLNSHEKNLMWKVTTAITICPTTVTRDDEEEICKCRAWQNAIGNAENNDVQMSEANARCRHTRMQSFCVGARSVHKTNIFLLQFCTNPHFIINYHVNCGIVAIKQCCVRMHVGGNGTSSTAHADNYASIPKWMDVIKIWSWKMKTMDRLHVQAKMDATQLCAHSAGSFLPSFWIHEKHIYTNMNRLAWAQKHKKKTTK